MLIKGAVEWEGVNVDWALKEGLTTDIHTTGKDDNCWNCGGADIDRRCRRVLVSRICVLSCHWPAALGKLFKCVSFSRALTFLQY